MNNFNGVEVVKELKEVGNTAAENYLYCYVA